MRPIENIRKFAKYLHRITGFTLVSIMGSIVSKLGTIHRALKK